jgi:thiamine monophosphate kinase
MYYAILKDECLFLEKKESKSAIIKKDILHLANDFKKIV